MRYIVKLTTKVKPEKISKTSKPTILVIEPEDYTNKEVKAIRSKGYKLIAYLSIGTISTERSWYKQYSQYKLKRLDDWPKEYYMDMRARSWQQFLVNRAKALKKRGFVGWWLDNLDVYEEYKSNSMYTACESVLKKIKRIGGYVMVNGGSEFFDTSIDKKKNLSSMVDGVTQEEVFSLIKDYSGKGKFGRQSKSQSSFYQGLLQKLLKNKIQTYLLEYTRDDAVKKSIKEFCRKSKMTGYYISGNVNL